SYLDDLLQDAFEGLDEQSLAEFEEAVREEQMRDAAAKGTVAPLVARFPTQPVGTPLAPAVRVVTGSVVEPVAVAPQPVVVRATDTRPAWADEPFECLLFDVA